MKYILLEDRLERKAGTVVYDCKGHDYGLASDDSRATGTYHVSVTEDSGGGYPFFTVAYSSLERIE